jgi:hypothetical protein
LKNNAAKKRLNLKIRNNKNSIGLNKIVNMDNGFIDDDVGHKNEVRDVFVYIYIYIYLFIDKSLCIHECMDECI